MGAYAVRRIAQAVPLLFGISVVIFAMLQMVPGGPLASGEGGSAASAERIAKLKELYGLDDPLYVQYLKWIGGILTGDWGTSLNTGRPVLELIGDRVPATLLLTGLAFGLAIVLAVPMGIIAARWRNSIFDYLTTGATFLGLATPSFWFGLMLLFVFTYSLGWLPGSGLEDLRQTHYGWDAVVDRLRHLVMPVLVLALIGTANLARYVRSSMLEVLDEDYVRTARGSGLPELTVVVRYGFKNAAIPVVTVAVLIIPELFLGAVITESIFGIAGMGRLFLDSANVRDYPVLLGILLVGAVLVVLSNLLADLLYGFLDPRVSYD